MDDPLMKKMRETLDEFHEAWAAYWEDTSDPELYARMDKAENKVEEIRALVNRIVHSGEEVVFEGVTYQAVWNNQVN
jgi:2-phosphoglycerate kinase